MGGPFGGSGTYTLSSGSLTAPILVIGYEGTGNFTQTGGTATVGDTLTLAQQPGSSGVYNLQGGSLAALNEVVGSYGSGAFTQSGGTNTVGGALNLSPATFTGGSSTYNLTDGYLSAGTVNLNDRGAFNQTGGTFDFSTFNHIAGSASFTDLYLGRDIGSSSTYNLSGGTLAATGYEYVGYSGTGSFTQSGGTHTVAQRLRLGWNAGSSGSYDLSGGSLYVADNETVGIHGSGCFNQSGGTHTAAQLLMIGGNAGASGSYNLSNNGSLAVNGAEFIGLNGGTGAFTQDGERMRPTIPWRSALPAAPGLTPSPAAACLSERTNTPGIMPPASLSRTAARIR